MINLTTEVIHEIKHFSTLKCLLYEPIAKDEGICTYDTSIVNINSGCENPEDCSRYKRSTLK